MPKQPPNPSRSRVATAERSAPRSVRSLPTVLLAAVLATVAVALSAASAGASATNLVPNPSFESSLSGWVGYAANIQRVSGGADGSWAASVTANTSASWSIGPSPRQVSSTVAGAVYNATAQVRARSGSKTVCITMREWSGSTIVGHALQCVTPTSSWQSFPTLSYTARSTGNSLDMYAFGRSGVSGDAFDVDAFSLTIGSSTAPAPPPPPAPLAVALTAPTVTSARGTVTVAASVTSGTAARVEFLANGKLIASDETSPYSVSWNTGGVADGTVSLVARAVASSGQSADSLAHSLRIDNTAPDTTITSGPSGTVTTSSASFGFGATETSTFECELNGGGWAACTSPRSYSGLPNGTHTFRVRATDALGNVDATPAVRTWTVSVSSPAPTGCSIDTSSMTAPGCTIVREDTAPALDPRPGLWGAIDCATSTRHLQHVTGGDPGTRSNGTSQGNAAYRQLHVVDGDNFYGQRCELGRNEWRYGENSATQTSGAMGLYREGERKITFFSQRYGAAFNPGVTTWQAVFQQKQAQPYAANGPVNGAPAIELQIYGNKLHIANFWSTKWSTAAPKLNTWIRYALDVTYSKSSSVGKLRLYADLNGDGDWNDAGEVSPILSLPTLAYVTTAGHGLNVGDSIPGHLRMGIYNNPTISCPAPSGCRVDVDNVQIVR